MQVCQRSRPRGCVLCSHMDSTRSRAHRVRLSLWIFCFPVTQLLAAMASTHVTSLSLLSPLLLVDNPLLLTLGT